MWKEHILTNAGLRVIVARYVEGTHTYQCRAACYSRPLCGMNIYLQMQGCVSQSTVMWREHLLTNVCKAACYSRPLCGRNTYLPIHGCVLQSTVMMKERLLTNPWLRVTVDSYVEGTPTYQCKAACYSRPLCGRNTYLPTQ